MIATTPQQFYATRKHAIRHRDIKKVRRFRGMTLITLLAIGAASMLTGCGSSGLSASSTCKDFMAASQEEQAQAISQLSSQFQTPEVATPLGSPSIAYTCSSNPDITLEDLFHKEHEGERNGF
jgi:hypothetical protein